ncbi:MAG: ParB/RepB/Spo0J family partition protein [Steroidobacteraceae bacterium]
MPRKTSPKAGAASAAVAAAAPQPGRPTLTDELRSELLLELGRWKVLDHKPDQVGLSLQQVAERMHVSRKVASALLIAAQDEGIVRYDGAYYTVATPPSETHEVAAPMAAASRDLGHVLLNLGLDQIHVVGNVRRHFDEGKLAELAASMREHGVLEPLVVRTDPRIPLDEVRDGGRLRPYRYVLVAGERRLRAARLADVRVVPVVVRDLDEAAAARLQLMENVQRVDLDPIEEAEAFEALVSQHGTRPVDLARELGVSESHISNRRRLLRLPESVRAEISHGNLSPSVAMAVLSLDVPDELATTIAADLVAHSVTQAQAASHASAVLTGLAPRVDGSFGARDSTCDPKLHRDCPCRRVCEERWGGKAAVCVDRARFDELEAAAQRKATEKAKAEIAKGKKPDEPGAGADVVDTQKLGYQLYENLNCPAAGKPPAEHAACPCLRIGRHGTAGKLEWVCVDPKAHRAMVAKASRQRNKAERAALGTENERILAWAATTAAAPVDVGQQPAPIVLGSRELAWLTAHVISTMQAEYVAGGSTARIGRHTYLRQRLGFTGSTPAVFDNGELVAYLATLPAEVLWRTCIEWPALCRGEAISRYREHDAFNWYRAQVGGPAAEAPGTAPLAEVLLDHTGGEEADGAPCCDLCLDDATPLLYFVNDHDPGAPVGVLIYVCAEHCGIPDDPDVEPDMDARQALEKLGWHQVDQVPAGAQRLDDDSQEYAFLTNRVQAMAVGERFCRICGCTPNATTDACDEAGDCHWVEDDLCSTCAERMAPAATSGADA